MLSHFSLVWLFVTLWTLAYQDPLSMGFSRQECWSGLPCPPPGDLPDPGIKPASLRPPALAGRFFTTSATWEIQIKQYIPCGSDGKASACSAGDPGSIPGLGKSLEGGHGKPLQYPCLENPMDRGAWQATVHGVTKSQTRLKWLSTHALLLYCSCLIMSCLRRRNIAYLFLCLQGQKAMGTQQIFVKWLIVGVSYHLNLCFRYRKLPFLFIHPSVYTGCLPPWLL